MLKQAMLFFSQLLVDQITYLSNTFLISRMNMPTRLGKKKNKTNHSKVDLKIALQSFK